MAGLNRITRWVQFAFAIAASFPAYSQPGPWNFRVDWQTDLCEKAGLNGATLRVLEPGADGEINAACRDVDATTAPSYVIRFDKDRNVMWMRAIGGSSGSDVMALRREPGGSLLAGGATVSADFPIVGGFGKQFTAGRERMGFVTRLDFSGKLVASSFLGGTGDSAINALEVDSSGAVIAAGSTTAKDFPTSGDAFISQISPGMSFVPPRYAFLFRFDAALNRMLYSTLIGSSSPRCSGGSNCLSAVASTTVAGIALDPQGNVVMAGTTTATGFPVWNGVQMTGGGASDIFVAKFAEKNTNVLWTSLFGGGSPILLLGRELANSLAVDASGNILIGGLTESSTFPVTDDAYRQPDPLSGSPVRRGFLTVLDPASQMLYSTVTDSEVLSTSIDADGGIWFSGGDRLSRLKRGQTILDYSQLLGGAGGRFSRTSGFLLWSPTSTVTALEFAAEQMPQMLTVSPLPIRVGDVMTVTGIGIGPADQKNAEIGPDGVLAEDVDSVRVFFNGLSGKMVKAGPDQLEVIVAAGIVGFGETLIDVTHGYDIVASRVVKIEDPAVRSLGVTNADGSSTAQIPAHAGDIISAYVWDPGVVDPACGEGAVSFAPTPLNVSVSATLDDKPGRITYAGSVPGYLCGLKQVNVEVPQVSRYTYEMQLVIGSVSMSMPVLVDWLR